MADSLAPVDIQTVDKLLEEAVVEDMAVVYQSCFVSIFATLN